MKKWCATLVLSCTIYPAFCWGFYAHKLINQYAVYLLPPEMMVLYKLNIEFIREHAVDPDKRRYAVKEEGPRHYIDLDHYRPWDSIPAGYTKAIEKYSADSLQKHGIAPWWIQTMMGRLTQAFEKKDKFRIIKLSAELGHYVADIHVPLHANSNHNGQYTNQQGIHGFWESRIPELLAEKQFDFIIGKAVYINSPSNMIWTAVRQSAASADTVLFLERELTAKYRADGKYSFEMRNGIILRQYSTAFSYTYHEMLNGMVERRMRQSIFAIASLWYTAWVNAGQPDLAGLANKPFTDLELKEWDELNAPFQQNTIKGRSCSN
jgi:hypothetical protein